MLKLGLALGLAVAALAAGGHFDPKAGWAGGFIALGAGVWLLLRRDELVEVEPKVEGLWITRHIRRSSWMWVCWWIVIGGAYLCFALASKTGRGWVQYLGAACVLGQAIWLWLELPIFPRK